QAVRRTLQRFTKEGPPPIESSFCSEEISIRGALTDVDRLVELLLRQATSATKAAGKGTVRCETSVEDGRALLVVKDQAGTVAPEQLKELFNTDGRVRSGGDS